MDTKEVEKIYNLANLSLDGKDTEDIAYKFNAVLDFIYEIFDVDTKDCELTEAVFSHHAVFREDEPGESISRDEALKNAKDTEFGYFRLDWNL